MRCGRQFASYEEFAREELRSRRSAAWCVDELADDFFLCADLDLDTIEGDPEPEDEHEDDDD